MPAPPTALRRDAAHNRERLLAAATALIAEHGTDVDVREIARCADVGMGTLYRHFPTKRALLDTALEHAFTEWADAARAATSGEPWSDLSLFLEDALDRQSRHRGLLEGYAAPLSGPGGAPPVDGGSERCRRLLRPVLAELVEHARTAGALRGDVTVEDVSLLLIALGRIAALAPDAWRRPLRVALDGLRAEAATPMPTPALTPEALGAMTTTTGREAGR